MSYREKSAWISLLSISGIYAFYFWSVLHSGARAGGVHVSGLLETIIALAVVQTVLTIGVAISAPREAKAPRDERDRLIDLTLSFFNLPVRQSQIGLEDFASAKLIGEMCVRNFGLCHHH